MSESPHRFIVAYDIADDPRRNRIAKLLQSYGDRIQFSVFLIDARPAKMVRLRATLRLHLDPGTDSVLVCDLGPHTHGGLRRISYLGLERTITGHDPLVL